MIYDPSRQARELRERIMSGMSDEGLADYNAERLRDNVMVIRICEKCGELRVLGRSYLEAQDGGADGA